MTSCPAGQSSRGSVLVTDGCVLGFAQSGIPITQEAVVCQILNLTAQSTIVPSQRAPGIWALDADNTIGLSQVTQGPGPGGTALHVLNHTAASPLALSLHVCTTGGRTQQSSADRCVTQVGHGLSVGDWIILDSATLDWTTAFDAGATIEDDAVGQVTSVDGNDFCYKPIGPICNVSGLTPGRTYFVADDGSGSLTLTEPTGVSVPRIFAISSSEGILLPYRPIDPSALGGGAKTNRVLSTLPKQVPGSGESFMRLDGDISHSEVPIVILNNSELQEVSIAVDVADSNDYDVKIYSDPTGTPSLVSTPLTLTNGNTSASVTGLSVTLNAGEYGVALARSSGSGASDFKNAAVVTRIVEV
jgi:hypothetical protein